MQAAGYWVITARREKEREKENAVWEELETPHFSRH
jgi:hypothetical protein